MSTYYIHYTDGTTEARHWCDECDEREAQTIYDNTELCFECSEEKKKG